MGGSSGKNSSPSSSSNRDSDGGASLGNRQVRLQRISRVSHRNVLMRFHTCRRGRFPLEAKAPTVVPADPPAVSTWIMDHGEPAGLTGNNSLLPGGGGGSNRVWRRPGEGGGINGLGLTVLPSVGRLLFLQVTSRDGEPNTRRNKHKVLQVSSLHVGGAVAP